MDALGWDAPDVILISGDTYIDSPQSGTAMLGHVLTAGGYRTAIIAQPDVNSPEDITRLGEPKLFWGVNAGCVDSMVANYTASGKPRRSDDFTPGGVNNRRPDRACMVYTNLIRRNFKNTVPIVLGGIEASLRRIAHYDFWGNKVRGSLLLDAKADYLLYGMSELSVKELAFALQKHLPVDKIRGLCRIGREIPAGAVGLPAFEDVRSDPDAFTEMFRTFYANSDPVTGKTLVQGHGDRYLIQNPPQRPLSQAELDAIYALPFERDVHPYYGAQGAVKALETIRFSVTSHRGCYGECNFCAIAVHEGRLVQWRSEASILEEIRKITQLPGFKGYIADLGGPTANMYGFECAKKQKYGACKDKRCLFPEPCTSLGIDHGKADGLLAKARKIPGVKQIIVASGIRYDMILADKGAGTSYLDHICRYHVSGQMKVAPEHHNPRVLQLMGKPGAEKLLEFRQLFERLNAKAEKKQFLTYYFIAAHPGCNLKDMQYLKRFADEQLHMTPEQTQIFTPTPSTWSTLMYFTGKNPFTGEEIFVEKDPLQRQKQKDALVTKKEFENDKRSDIQRSRGKGTERTKGKSADHGSEKSGNRDRVLSHRTRDARRGNRGEGGKERR